MNPETRALERGVDRKREMVYRAGGCLSSREVAELLGIGVSAVDGQVKNRSILPVPLSDGEWGFPSRQFIDGEMRDGVADVVRAAGNINPWILLSILLDSVDDGSMLLDRLGDPTVQSDVLNRVHTYGDHIAA